MSDNCMLCGQETERGGFSNRATGVLLRPLCENCDYHCSTHPKEVAARYPWIFDLNKPGAPAMPAVAEVTQADPITPQPASQRSRDNPLVKRYVDLYRVARLLITTAAVVKVIAGVVGVGIFLVWLLLSSGAAAFSDSPSGTGPGFVFVGLLGGAFFGGVAGGFIFLCGIFIAAQGQLLLAQADIAINTSPFLDQEERRQAMSSFITPVSKPSPFGHSSSPITIFPK